MSKQRERAKDHRKKTKMKTIPCHLPYSIGEQGIVLVVLLFRCFVVSLFRCFRIS